MVRGAGGVRGLIARVAMASGLSLIAVVLAFNGGVAVAAAGACPNEQLRQESNPNPVPAAEGKHDSQLLPECRAYEMVSPPFKQSHDAGISGGFINGFYSPGEVAAAPGGGALLWTSQGDFSEPQNYTGVPSPEQPFVSRRSGESETGWTTSASVPPQTQVNQETHEQEPVLLDPNGEGPFGDFSADLTSDQAVCGWDNVVGSTQAVKQAIACVRREGGTGSWIRTPLFKTPEAENIANGDGHQYQAGSADLSRLFLQVTRPLLPEDEVVNDLQGSNALEATSAIYELDHVSPEAQLRIVNWGHEGAKPRLLVRRPQKGLTTPPLVGNGAPGTEYDEGSNYHAASESGETTFFVATPEDSEKETGRTAQELNATAIYARIPCESAESSEFPTVPCEKVERNKQMVEGRQTIKVSDPNEAEGCAACATPTAVGSATTTATSAEVRATGGFPGVKAGMAVSGTGIPSGTVVSSVTASAIMLSKAATKTTAPEATVTLTFSPIATAVTTVDGSPAVSVSSGGFPGVKVGMVVAGPGVPSGATVTSYVAGESTLTMSTAATASAAGTATLTFKTVLGAPTPEEPPKPSIIFQGASADGSKVFFTTSQRVLLPTGSSDSSINLYEYDFSRKGDKVVNLSPDHEVGGSAGVRGVVRASSNGGYVYFIATGALTNEKPIVGETASGEKEFGPAAVAGNENLYGVDTNTGQLRFIAAVSGLTPSTGALILPHAQTTPDGRYLAFDSKTKLAGDTNPEPVNALALSKIATGSGTETVTFSNGTSSTTVNEVEVQSGRRELRVRSGGFPGVTVGMTVTVENTGTGPVIFAPATAVVPSATPEVAYRYNFRPGEEHGELTWISQASPELKAERKAAGESLNPNEGLSAWVSQVQIGERGGFADIDDFDRAITGESEVEAPGKTPEQRHDGEDIIFTSGELLGTGITSFPNEAAQLYLWHCASPCPKPNTEAEVHLISSGRDGVEPGALNGGEEFSAGNHPTTAISASGSDIFFTTRIPLVGQDADELIDYYDARIDGGQPAPRTVEPCAGEACQGPVSSSKPTLGGLTGSSALLAGGNLGPPGAGALAFRTAPPPKVLTRAQKLAKALQACKRQRKRSTRVACERRARKSYGKPAKAKKASKHAKR
jgi:hypothetical protein